ncbi:MAG TPA: hypothetical protein VLW50_08790 [Streptosporangiaceae bacterium]|nr:hypothetical protein [Streptosporangiaceae bacterium]
MYHGRRTGEVRRTRRGCHCHPATTPRCGLVGRGIRPSILRTASDRPAAGPRRVAIRRGLAVHLNGLRREVESLATKVEALASTQQEHGAVLDDISELRYQVEQILATLTEGDGASPAESFWLRMSEQVRDDKLSELFRRDLRRRGREDDTDSAADTARELATPRDGYAAHEPSAPTGCSSTVSGTFDRSSASTPAITTTDTGPTSPASNDRPIRSAKLLPRWTCQFSGGRCSAA